MQASLVVRNGTALVGTELKGVPLGRMRLAEGEIAEIAPADAVVDGSDGDAIAELNLEGGYVLSALVDAHVHLSLSGDPDPFSGWDGGPGDRMACAMLSGLRCLSAGIAAVRDLGCPDHTVIEYGRMVESGTALGPRVLAAGRALTAPEGHIARYSRVAQGAEELRRAAEEQLEGGAGVIKLMASGGFTSGTDPNMVAFGPDELEAAVATAHSAGVSAAAHAHSGAAVRTSLEAGMDTIEHAAYAGRATHERIAAAGATLVPTLHAVVAATPEGDPAGAERVARFRESVATAIAAGTPIAAGTDAGTPNNPSGRLLEELLEYRALGMSDHDALRAATVVAGGLIGEGVGVLETGARADLIVVPRDPRRDVEALREIRFVIIGGRVIDHAALVSSLAGGGHGAPSPTLATP